MNNGDNLTELLTIVLMITIFILFVLIMVYFWLKFKNKEKTKKDTFTSNEINKGAKTSSTVAQNYNKQSIFDFMEFNKVEDNMIIQKNGKRFLMVIECQGINYDLMSGLEKNGVEEGFLSFLNSLRHPIQIYIQTRTVNLENSIATYKKRIREVSDKLTKMEMQYNEMVESGTYTKEQLQQAEFELTKQRNLYEYGSDVVYNTELMSKNKNILNKKYYIIVPYYSEEANNDKYAKEEIQNMAFSELYTKTQSVVRTLSACSVSGKIMNSLELVDLLYEAYNRDESEVFGIRKAIKASYDELYTTAPDVLDKRMKILNKDIERQAIQKANEAIEEAKSEKQRMVEEQEARMDDLIEQMAEILLEQNKRHIGEDIAEIAIEKVKGSNTQEKGDNEDVQKERKTRQRTTTRTKKQ